MNKKLIIHLSIPLILIGQEVFASGGIKIESSPFSAGTMNNSQLNPYLVESAKTYNPKTITSPYEIKTFPQQQYEFSNEYKNSEIYKTNPQNTWDEIYPRRKSIMPKNQQKLPQYPNSSQPKWWRSESSYEGWKFD